MFKWLFNRKKYAKIKNGKVISCGELKGSYRYFKKFKKKHPTYDTIVSDYLT